MTGVAPGMEHDERGRLRDLSTSLMRLHRLLLDRERGLYEDRHGTIPTRELFSLVLNDEQFAWLRSLSTLIAQIDEVVDADRVVVLHRGKVLADTTPARLIAEAEAATIEEAFLAMTEARTIHN